jgi:hypothetical protein
MLRRGSLALLALAILGGCRLPQARLPERQVDDPVTLPRGTVTISTGYAREETPIAAGHSGTDYLLLGDVRWALTDRAELKLPGILRYGLLDERPPSGRPLSAITLAIFGGLGGWVLGSEQTALAPTLGLRAGRRLLPSVAFWTEASATVVTQTAPQLAATSHSWQGFMGVTWQLVSRLAVDAGATASVFAGRSLNVLGGAPLPRRQEMKITPALALRGRVAWWLDLTASGGVTRTRNQPERPRAEDLSPDDPVPARSVPTWAPRLTATATFRW